LLAYRQVLFVMGNAALYLTFDDQIFIGRELALEHQSGTDD